MPVWLTILAMAERAMIFVKGTPGEATCLVDLEKASLGKSRWSWGMEGGNTEAKSAGLMEEQVQGKVHSNKSVGLSC